MQIAGQAKRKMNSLATMLCMWVLASPAPQSDSAAQSNQPPLPVDPTPLVDLLSAREQKSVQDAGNPKKAVEAYLKISNTHIDLVAKAIEGGDYKTAERELDIYSKAAAEAGRIAFSAQDDKRKMAKKIEQTLLRQIRLLESVERRFPAERLRFAEAALDQARALRVRALNEAFAGGDILKNPSGRRKSSGQWTVGSGQWAVASARRPQPTGHRRLTIAHFLPVDRRPPPTGHRLLSTAHSLPPTAQIPGDYLNEEEDDHVRQAQQIDERTKVFMKIADRRLAAMHPASAQPLDKKAQKKADEELREWGELPKASRVELLLHYARAVEECIAKMEDAHERNPKSSAIPKALKLLLDATDRHLQILQALESEVKEEGEVAAFRRALDQAKTANEGAREGLKSP